MKNNYSKMNFGLLIIMIIFSIFGLIMIFSASSIAAVLRYQVSSNHFVIRQLVSTIGGFILGFIIMAIPTKQYRFFSKILIYGMTCLLAFLFIGGVAGGGAQSWFDLGAVNFQPSEFGKLFIIIYLAVSYNKMSGKKKINAWQLLKPLIPVVLIFFLVAAQPDLGGAAIIGIITFMIYTSIPYATKQKRKLTLIGLGAIAVGAIVVLLFQPKLLQSYQMRRILDFQRPCERYSEETGYQVCNGYIAIKNGGIFGVGLGKSTQKYLYLPEAHTDFIFPIICEELGIIVAVVILILYFIMLYIILGIAKETDNIRNSILAYGVFAYLLSHILINLLGVLGLIPLTGVPLPFLSYGGTYNLCILIALFIVERVSIENKLDKQRRKIENL